MNTSNIKNKKLNIPRYLILLSGLILILLALFYNEFLITLLSPMLPLKAPSILSIRSIQLTFLITGITLVVVSECIKRIPILSDILSKPIMNNSLLVVISLFMFVFVLELFLRPFVDNQFTSIFVPDKNLGWKLKPNSEDEWGGVKVKINGKGLRGPELNYKKPPNVIRVLYLGDSITFGYKLADYEQTFPYQIESILKANYRYNIETVNAGVGGYSPWQEYKYLTMEGVKYSPDLMIVSFVLNDVVEKFELSRFGGTDEGYQLGNTVITTIDKLTQLSSIAYFTKKIGSRLRFGNDIENEAETTELLNVKSLILNTEDKIMNSAWEMTLLNLGKIIEFAKTNKIPIIVAIFPYKFQFDNIQTLSYPQRKIISFTKDYDIPAIDLLSALAAKIKDNMLDKNALFLDENHLSALGNKIVANILVEFIQGEKILCNDTQK